jgi:hypothetical protein
MNRTRGYWYPKLQCNGAYCYIYSAPSDTALAEVFLPNANSTNTYEQLAPERIANARLMAAAPAMLHALMAALEPAGDTPEQVRAEMLAAVRKATGETV